MRSFFLPQVHIEGTPKRPEVRQMSHPLNPATYHQHVRIGVRKLLRCGGEVQSGACGHGHAVSLSVGFLCTEAVKS